MEPKNRNTLGLLLLFIGCFFFYQVFYLGQKRVELQKDYAEITNIKYGLFNPEIWKEKITTALYDKIDKLDLSGANRFLLQTEIEKSLNVLVDELNKYIDREKNSGEWYEKIFKNLTVEIVYKETNLRNQIPHFADEIINKLDSDESKAKLKEFLKAELNKFLVDKVGKVNDKNLNILLKKYNSNTAIDAQIIIRQDLDSNKTTFYIYTFCLFTITLLVFFIAFKQEKFPNILMYGSLILLWIPGIFLPIMSIGAQIENITFRILGSEFEFTNQTLFFQSKSIIGLVHVLITKKDPFSLLVGFFVIFFSVIFPIIKLLLNYIYNITEPKSKITKYIVTYGAKWSMADVFVAAIFMGFIGFKSLIGSQLTTIKKNTNFSDMETVNLTEFQPAILFFIGFVIMSILYSNRLLKFKN